MIFKSITIKNLLSYGNNPVTFNFNESQLSIITGKNGCGKSSILDALYFALTGKPYRDDINKGDLVNTINKKDCLVELSFLINNISYLIKRGIKPNIFEIYKDNVKIDEESHSKDYQEVLENITGLTPSIIRQILIISNLFYIPFLRLKAEPKRDFIENILGITLLSEMNDSLKQRVTSLKQQESFLEKDLERINSNIEIIQEYNNSQVDDSELRKEIINRDILELEESNIVLEKYITDLNVELKDFNEKKIELKKYLDYKQRVVSNLATIEAELRTINKNIKFYSNDNICPTCNQEIRDAKEKLELSKKELELLNEKQEQAKKRMDKIEKTEAHNYELQNLIHKDQLQISKFEINITNNNQKILELKKELNAEAKVSVDNESKLINLNEEKNNKINEKIRLSNEKKNVIIVQKLIGDKGFKRSIINRYLPIINDGITRYLEILGAKYKLILIDEFECKIQSRGYETLSYGSFSAGEKQRCDVSLMMSFLDVIKGKNNVNCNLIIFDEATVSLDDEGVECLEKLFNYLKSKKYSVNVITHDDKIKELADITYLTTKKKFTNLEII